MFDHYIWIMSNHRLRIFSHLSWPMHCCPLSGRYPTGPVRDLSPFGKTSMFKSLYKDHLRYSIQIYTHIYIRYNIYIYDIIIYIYPQQQNTGISQGFLVNTRSITQTRGFEYSLHIHCQPAASQMWFFSAQLDGSLRLLVSSCLSLGKTLEHLCKEW